MGLVTTTKEPPRSALGSTLRAVRSEFRGGSAIGAKDVNFLDNTPTITYIEVMKETNRKKETMKKTKTDPVKDFQKQAVDQRVCLFYVADRVKGILEDSKTDAQLRRELEEFNDECIHNIGVNALIEKYEY